VGCNRPGDWRQPHSAVRGIHGLDCTNVDFSKRLRAEVGNVTSKHNGVVNYRCFHVLRAITICSYNGCNIPRAMIVRNNNGTLVPKPLTVNSPNDSDTQRALYLPEVITFLHCDHELCVDAKTQCNVISTVLCFDLDPSHSPCGGHRDRQLTTVSHVSHMNNYPRLFSY
jgi:hypothetical protein